MRVDSLTTEIRSRLVVIAHDATLRVVASALAKPRIGLLVVCDENKVAIGVVSKSDLVAHIAKVGPSDVPVRSLMSSRMITCRPDDDLLATWQMMAAQGLQNIPVLCSESRPLGVLDIRDALKSLFEDEEHQEQLLINYIAGVGYQ